MAQQSRGGFTLIEALVTTTIAAIAGSALLLGAATSVQTATLALEQTVADGMAQQLLDEICSKRYHAVGGNAYETTLGPSAFEQGGVGRERYNDLDDFHGLRSEPAKDLNGITLGIENGTGGQRHTALQAVGYFDNWVQEVDVFYLSAANLSVPLTGSATSDYRRIEVRIYLRDPIHGKRLVTKAQRVVSYVPST